MSSTAIPTNSYVKVPEVIPSGWTPAPPDPLWGRAGRVVRVVIEGVEQTAACQWLGVRARGGRCPHHGGGSCLVVFIHPERLPSTPAPATSQYAKKRISPCVIGLWNAAKLLVRALCGGVAAGYNG